jgi:hypothetical protein
LAARWTSPGVWSAEFLQFADAVELKKDDPDQSAAIQTLIRAFAKAVLDGTEPPQWHLDDRGRLALLDQ